MMFVRSYASTQRKASGFINRRKSIVLMGVGIFRRLISDYLRSLFKGGLISAYLFTTFRPLFLNVEKFAMVVHDRRFANKCNGSQFSNRNKNVCVFHRRVRLTMRPFFLFFFVGIIRYRNDFLMTFALPRVFFIEQVIIAVLCRIASGFCNEVIFLAMIFTFKLCCSFVRKVQDK